MTNIVLLRNKNKGFLHRVYLRYIYIYIYKEGWPPRERIARGNEHVLFLRQGTKISINFKLFPVLLLNVNYLTSLRCIELLLLLLLLP